MEAKTNRLAALQKLVDAHGLAEASIRLGKPARQISDMLHGRKSFGEKVARAMERNYDKTLPAGWLDGIPTNTGPARLSLGKDEEPEFWAATGAVPLISWIRAGAWHEVADPYAVGDAEEWLPCPVKHGPRTYCLRVRGDSMNNPGGRPSYANGDIIFVDPDRGSNHGDRVIVRLDDQAEATFKQLHIEDGRKMLKALNPDWVPKYIEINGNATVTGVVIGKWVPE